MQLKTLLESRPTTGIVSAKPDDSITDVVRVLREHRIGAMPVMAGETVVGIVSERDVVRCLATRGTETLDLTVAEVMTAPVITVECSASCEDAMGLMTERRVRHLPVMEKGSMRGFLSIGDLVKTRLEEVRGEAAAMRDYIRLA